MTAVTRPPSDVSDLREVSAFGDVSALSAFSALGQRIGGLTPGIRSSLRTGAVAATLLGPAVVVLSSHRPWGLTLFAIVLGGLGLVLASIAVIELLPTPGRLVFHEHGFADIRPDSSMDLYLDGTAVVHTVPSENLPPSARAMGDPPTSSVATR
ncbi:hypothetical protein [Lapillicoccus sp.]|uniref:hypothetical protein n=1 Tax=Lapillicoccus sp. TaxID=1909287 RepID=UPI0025F2A9FE|nr:hypothetical protein [Lapillicoccus sp.]